LSPRLLQLLALTPLVLAGCGGKDNDKVKDLLDTGWFVDTAVFDAENCKNKISSTLPETGTNDWYWKSPLRVYTSTTNDDAYTTWLVDGNGAQVEMERVWSPDGLNFELNIPGGLKSSTNYTLNINDCGANHAIDFTTSAFGEALLFGPEALVGKTYHLDLVDADWVEPGGIGGLLALYFTTPILIGVKVANPIHIDFMGVPGELDEFGVLQQDMNEATWDFPLTDFRDAPYFQAFSDGVTFSFEGLDVPIVDFRLAGTFSADMTEIGGIELSGLGDTRNLGELINDSDETAVCQLAGTFGVDCIECPDGEDLCLFMNAREVDGTLVPGITLVDN